MHVTPNDVDAVTRNRPRATPVLSATASWARRNPSRCGSTREQQRRGFGGFNAARSALKQPRAQFAFERRDRARDGRRCGVAITRNGAQAALAHHVDENVERGQVHLCPVFICASSA
jgi:hypothetical protein